MHYSYPMRALFLTAMLCLASLTSALAQGRVDKFPVPFGPTNAGREFWFSFPTNWDASNVTDKYLRLYITAGVETDVEVTANGFYQTIKTIPYDIVTVDIPTVVGQVVVRDDRAPVPMDQVHKKRGVHVKADAPVVVYAMNRTNFTTDGFLAIPTSGLGREYIVASAADIADGSVQKLPSQYVITAPYDGTLVTIVHPMDSPNHLADEPFNITLDEGDVFSAMSVGPRGDLTGTWIRASKPIAVNGGQACTYLPTDIRYCCCDHLVEMLLPTSSWGKFYQAIPYDERKLGDMYRVFASEPNTKVYINGNFYGTINNVGGINGGGWFEIELNEREPMEFSADKPISVAQYNHSQQWDGSQTDPFYIVLTPVEQYQTQLVFSTPHKDYTNNRINLICDSLGYYEMEIAAGGTEKWEKVWKKFGPFGRKFPTKIDGKTFVGKTLSIQPGTYRLRGPSPFAGYIYGFSAFDSYGYPLSVAVGDLSIKDTVAPDISWEVDCDGTVTGLANDMPDPDNERSNLSLIELEDGSVNYVQRLLPPILKPGLDRVKRFRFEVIDKTKDAVAYLVVSDMAGNVSRDTIRYTAFNVIVDPTPLAFGGFIVGQSTEKTITIRNLANTPIEIKEARLKLRNQGFTLLEPMGAFTLGPAGSPTDNVKAKIRFDAEKGGQFNDSLGLEDACGFRNMALVTAVVGTPIIKVSDIDWEKTQGPVLVNTPARDEIMTVSNFSTDGATLTIYPPAVGPVNTVIFSTPDGQPVTAPFDLAAGESRRIKVGFRPNAPQVFLDSIVFSSNAPPNPANDSVGLLRGVGFDGELLVTSKPWDRHRVGTGPHWDTVTLTNVGTGAQVQVMGALTEGDVNDFGYDASRIANVIISQNEVVKLPVYFAPKQIGNREMRIKYNKVGDTKEYVSTLTGIGIIPRLATEDVDFGSMRVGSPDVNQPVRFYIPADVDKFTDSVTITGLRFRGTDGDFAMKPLDTAVTLIPGKRDTLTLTGLFAATTAGPHTTSLAAITPDPLGNSAAGAPPDTVSVWTGVGTTDNGEITVTSANRTTCPGDTTFLVVTISNNSPEPVTVNGLTLTGSSDFTLMESTTQFTVNAGTTRDITIRFTPTATGSKSGTLTVANNGKTGDVVATLTGDATTTTVPASIEMTGSKGATGELSKEVYAAVKIDAPIGAAQVSSYKLTLTYDPKLLIPNIDPVSFRIGGANPSATATYNGTESSRGKMVIDVVSATPLNLPGELLRVEFKAVFNTELKRSVGADVLFTGTNSQCATVTSATSSIQLEPICGLSVRMIEMTANKYSLGQNNPNPGGQATKIDYSLGLDGPTTMVLFNAEGQLVQTLIDEYQQPGGYELTIDTSNLPSGSYFYKLVSGAWSQTRRMDIAK